MPDLGRIYFPANDINNIFFISDIDNTRGTNANISFRITVKDGRRFNNLQYKLGEDDWKTFNPRNISANLYIVRLKPGQMERLLLRLSTGDEEIIVRSVNVQHSINVKIIPPPQPKMDIVFDISILDMPAKQFKTDTIIKREDNEITNTLIDIMVVPRPQGLLLDWQAEKVNLASGRVNSVPDQSGNNRDGTTTSSSTRPGYIASDPDCNGKSSIVIDDMSSKSFLQHDFTSPANQPLTYVLVFRGMSTDPGEFYSSTTHAFGTNSVNQYTLTDGVTEFTGGVPDTNIHVEIVRMNSANSQLYIDGDAPKITASFSGSTLSNIVVGDATGPIKEFKMVRFAIWDRALTNAELNQLGSYLARECNITWTPIDPHKFIDIDMHLTQNDRPMNFNADIMTFKDNNVSSFKADISITRQSTASFTADIMIMNTLPVGLFIDYDPNFVELTSGKVTKLLDQGGGSRDATRSIINTNGDPPTYIAKDTFANGNATIRFNEGTNSNGFDSEDFSSSVSNSTIFYVSKGERIVGPSGVINTYDFTATQLRIVFGRNQYTYGSNSSTLTQIRIGKIIDGSGEIVAMTADGTDGSISINGGAGVSGKVGGGPIERFSIGVDRTFRASEQTPILFVRALMWNRILSKGEIAMVCRNIADKYNFTCNAIDISVPQTFTCDMILINSRSTEVKCDIILESVPASSPPNNNNCCCCDHCNEVEGPTRGEPPKVYTVGMDIICKKQQVINMKFSMSLLKEGSL